MAWQSGKPLGPDQFNISQGDIKDNFGEIDTFVNVDHEGFGAAAVQGKHKQVTLRQQVAAPVTLADEFALYTKSSGGVPALFLRKPPVGATPGVEVDFSTSTLASPGTATLPCGLILKWGTGSISVGASSSSDITFATAFPTGVFICQLAANTNNTGAAQDYVFFVNTFNTTTLKAQRNSSFTGTVGYFNYLALGY